MYVFVILLLLYWRPTCIQSVCIIYIWLKNSTQQKKLSPPSVYWKPQSGAEFRTSLNTKRKKKWDATIINYYFFKWETQFATPQSIACLGADWLFDANSSPYKYVCSVFLTCRVQVWDSRRTYGSIARICCVPASRIYFRNRIFTQKGIYICISTKQYYMLCYSGVTCIWYYREDDVVRLS